MSGSNNRNIQTPLLAINKKPGATTTEAPGSKSQRESFKNPLTFKVMKFCSQPQNLLICKPNQVLPVLNTNDQSKKRKPKIASNNLPWVGSYFNMPEPEEIPKLQPKTEVILQVLMKDLSIREYRLITHSTTRQLLNEDTICLNLRLMAYKDPDAIAHMTYYYDINPITGERKTAMESNPAMRIGKYEWEWVSNYKDEGSNKFSTARFFNNGGY